VLVRTIEQRTGWTPYVRWNDGPALALSSLVLAAGWAARRRPDEPRRRG
jgi:hypothetical protein